MTTGNTDEKSVIDDVFVTSSDMGADSAAPGSSPEVPAPEAKAPEPEPKAEEIVKADDVPDDDGQPQGRDPKTGRFVPVTELVAERKKLKEARDNEFKLRTEAEANAKVYREQVEQLQRQFQQIQRQQQQPQQQAVEPPDPYLEPEKFAQYQQQMIDQRLLDHHVNTSELLTRQKYGDEIVNAALQAAYQAGISERFVRTRHPFEALVAWHKKQQIDAEVGTDLEAFKKRVAEDAVQKALAGLKAGQPLGQAQTPQKFPSTLADQTQAGDQGALLTERAAADSVFAHRRSA